MYLANALVKKNKEKMNNFFYEQLCDLEANLYLAIKLTHAAPDNINYKLNFYFYDKFNSAPVLWLW